MICPRTNDALSAFISARASAVTWSPVEVLAVHLEVVLCDSSTSSTNHRFKTLQYLMYGRTSDSVETSTYLLSCEACTEGNGYFFFQLIFRPQLGESLFIHFPTSGREELWAEPLRWMGKWKKQLQGFILRKNLKETWLFPAFSHFLFAVKSICQILQMLWDNPKLDNTIFWWLKY